MRERRVPDLLATSGLLGALVGGALLAVEAYSADGARRNATARALEQLASVAAWEFARQASSQLDHGARMALWATVAAAPALATNHAAHADIHCDGCAPPVVGSSRFSAVGQVGALAMRPGAPSDVPADRLLAAANAAAQALRAEKSDGTIIGTLKDMDGQTRIVAAMGRWTSASDLSVYGIVAPEGWFEQVLARAVSRQTLLPTLLNRPMPLDSGVSVVVRTTAGEVVFRSEVIGAPVDSRLRGTATLALADSLVADVTLTPATAAVLSDAVPRARPVMPMLLFALTALVLVLAVAHQRRSSALARQRVDFLASISHDFNTPLALVMVHAETLLKPGAVPDEHRDAYTRVVLREARRLSRLVENALRFTDIQRGLAPLDICPIDLSSLLHEAVTDFGPLASARGAVLSLAMEPNGLVVVDADRDAMRQVLFNLFDNAVKYGPAGQTVLARVTSEKNGVILTVDDEGPGIPRRDRQRVFRQFVRLRPVEAGAPSGSGIGLAVAQDLCARMGARISLTTSPGGGTRVTLRFVRSSFAHAERNAVDTHDAAPLTD